jgi:hypothetical protein
LQVGPEHAPDELVVAAKHLTGVVDGRVEVIEGRLLSDTSLVEVGNGYGRPDR